MQAEQEKSAISRDTPVEDLSLNPPVLLPDGSEFKTWKSETVWTKTFVVDQNHIVASDANPGTADRPFLTIGRAASTLAPGERVVVKSGVYREKIVPRQGGLGPDAMIGYEAAPGSRVLVKGSKILRREWELSKHPVECSQKLWMIALTPDYFENENPFAVENASEADLAIMPWATEWTGHFPFAMRRGMLFQEGRRMVQLAEYADLRWLPGSFWVEPSGLVLHAHPFGDLNPNAVEMEITVRQQVVCPATTDLGYVRISGFTFMHAANGFPRTGVGALFTAGGHHWIIENNTVCNVNSVGIEIGTRSIETADKERGRKDQERASKSPGCTIVRNNRVFDCGRGGIQGYQVRRALVERNWIHDCGWWDVEKLWETGGVKLLLNESTLVRRNRIERITGGPAIWFDWNNKNSRITGNLMVDIESCNNGAVFVEATRQQIAVDHNIFWDIHGSAVCAGDTDNLLVAHNLIGPCTGFAVRAKVLTDRQLDGRAMTARGTRVCSNVFLNEKPVEFSDIGNVSDFNAFSNDAFDLAAWQNRGQDRGSVRAGLSCPYDRDKAELAWSANGQMPTFQGAQKNDTDFYGTLLDVKATPPGPFADRFANPVVLNVDPRMLS